MRFIYPYCVFQSGDGAWQVRFPDVPEALTEGDTEAEAHGLAQDALLAALGGLAKLKHALPVPSEPTPGQHIVVVPMAEAAKLALYQAMQEQGLTNVKLAQLLGQKESEVRRMLDLDHATKIATLESVLGRLGKRMTAEVSELKEAA